MNKPLDISGIHDAIVELRGQRVLIDSDVAKIYGVATRNVNKAVANNPNKFPEGYILELNKSEKLELVENFHRLWFMVAFFGDYALWIVGARVNELPRKLKV